MKASNDLTNRTFMLFLTVDLACRGVGGIDGKPVRNCRFSLVFDYTPCTAERDRWLETQKMLKEFKYLKGVKRAGG